MNQSMISASVTMGQLQKKLDTISNNIANVNTTGFKQREVQFRDLLFQQVNNQIVNAQETGRNTPFGIRVGAGSAVSTTNVRMEQGSIQTTDRPLDLALTQKGVFFEVMPTEDEERRRFTRDGAFYLSPNPVNEDELYLVNGDGNFIMSSEGERIVIPANYNSIHINDSGFIRVNVEGELEEQVDIAQLQLVRITKPQLLENIGDNFFTFPNLEELELDIADVLEAVLANENVLRQNALEMSNVDMGKQLSDLLIAQRSYQFNARSISMADQMMGLVNGLR